MKKHNGKMDKLGGQSWMWFRKMKNRHPWPNSEMYKVCMNFVLGFLQRKIGSLLPKFQDFEVSVVLGYFLLKFLLDLVKLFGILHKQKRPDTIII